MHNLYRERKEDDFNVVVLQYYTGLQLCRTTCLQRCCPKSRDTSCYWHSHLKLGVCETLFPTSQGRREGEGVCVLKSVFIPANLKNMKTHFA